MTEVVPAREAKHASPPHGICARRSCSHPACWYLGAALALAIAASPATAATAASPDISGVWWATTYSPKIQPVGGGDLPYTPARQGRL